MAVISEQFSAAARDNLQAQIALLTTLSQKSFEGMQKLVELNVSTARNMMEESSNAVRQLMTAKDPQEFVSLSASRTQPAMEKAISYGRNVASIASGTQAELTRVAEEQFSEANRKTIALVDQLSQNAPAGTENAVALFKSAIGTANAGYEQMTKTTKQAVEAMEANVSNAVSKFSKAAPAQAAAATSEIIKPEGVAKGQKL